VSRNLAAGTGRGSSRCPRVSGDGQRVVFESDVTDLVKDDAPGTNDVFVFDRGTGALRRILATTGVAPSTAARPAVSADGHTIVFDAKSVDATPDQRSHIYRASVGTTTDVEDLGEGYGATVSGDGRIVAFVTSLPGAPQVIRVIGPGLLRNASPSAGLTGAEDVFAPALSADGQWIAYVSRPRSLHPGGTDARRSQVYVERVSDGFRQLVSVTPHGREANGFSRLPAIDATGSRVIFESTATNLGCASGGTAGCDTDINLLGDIFQWNHATGTVTRVNIVTPELPWLEGAAYPTISLDGGHIGFLSRQPVSPADGRDSFDMFITRAVKGDATPLPIRGGGR
jgi:Tol biopolymer transport system component